jgi:hypothetical protein
MYFSLILHYQHLSTGYRHFFQEETTQMHTNALKVSPYPPTLNSLKNIPRHTPWPNRRPVQHPGGQWMPQLSRTARMMPENKTKKKCVCFFFHFLCIYWMYLTTAPSSHMAHPTPSLRPPSLHQWWTCHMWHHRANINHPPPSPPHRKLSTSGM